MNPAPGISTLSYGIDERGAAATGADEDVNRVRSVMEYRDRLDFALEATGTGLWSYDQEVGTFDWDDRTRSLWGFTRDGAVTRDELLSRIDTADVAGVVAALDRAPSESAPDTDTAFRIRRFDDGVERWLALRSRHESAGGHAEVVGTMRDISDQRRHDAQVHLLMREVTHRSKNLLAIIQAMARQTVKDSLTAADFERRFSARLRGLSFSHEILAAQNWRGASLGELAHGHLGALLDQHGERVQIQGPTVFIGPEAAQNIGLAFNELTSNAVKYGALSSSTGRVSVQWSLDSDEGNGPGGLLIVWSESGGTAVQPPLRQGFGHKVMERVVARALDGVVNMSFAPSGLRWSLRIPLHHLATDVDTPGQSG